MALKRRIPLLYAGLCVLAFGVFLAGLPAIAGEDADPLAGIFIFLLALPWIFALDALGELPLWATALASIAAMGVNFLILSLLLRRTARRNSGEMR